MSKITTTQKNHLNKMNRAAADVQLGTILQGLQGAGTFVSGSHTVTTAEASASRVVLTTGLTSVNGFYNSYLRSGSPVSMTWSSGSVAGTITVMNNASASAVIAPTTDVASFIAF